MQIVHAERYRGPGTVVRVAVRTAVGVVQHHGLTTDTSGPDGLPMIISNSKRRGGVVEETWTAFAEGATVDVLGYWSKLAPAQVVARARGDKRQWFVNDNCEHYVRRAHALPAASPQLQDHVVIGTLIVAVAGIAAVALTDGA